MCCKTQREYLFVTLEVVVVMPIMTRMRENMPAILFGLLIAFLITIVFEWGMDYLGITSGRGQHTAIGSVNGEQITFQEFSQMVQNVSDNQRQQSNIEPSEEQLRQIRQQVWDQIVNQRLIDEQIRKLGITVTDQEIVDWVRGENPPEDLKRNFIDSAGNFRRDIYEQFLRDPNQFIQDPQGVDRSFGSKWLADYEKTLRVRRQQEKLQSLLTASVRVTEAEVRKRFQDQNIKYDVVFALLDPNVFVKDEEVTVGEEDLKAYYEENLELYKVPATRKLKYVTFIEKPSASDSAAKMAEIDEALKKAREGQDFLQLVELYSDRPDSGAWFRHGELAQGIENAVFSAKKGDIVGPIVDLDGYHIIKVLDERKADREYVRASHILLQLIGPDSNQVKAKARELAQKAKAGADFAALAAAHSGDPSNAQKGGDLGWFTRGRMVKEFEEACFKAKVGEVVGPIRTTFGLHIIKVTGRDARELKLASIVTKLLPSSQTRNEIAERAREFALLARESDFTKEAQALGLEVREAEVQEKGGVIPGLGINEAATKWAFRNKVGSVSEPFTITSGWAVFTVIDAKEAGVRPFDEVKEGFRPQVVRKKKLEKVREIAASLKAKLSPSDSLRAIARLDPRVQVQSTGPFSASSGVPGVGLDLNFVGVVEGLNVGQISAPFTGFRGVYLVQLLSRTPFDSTAYVNQREILRNQMLQEKRNRYVTQWLGKLKESADIEDNRDLFYR